MSYRPRVISLSDDAQELKIALTLPSGERIIGRYSLAVWSRPPAKVRARALKTLARPPRRMVGARAASR